MVKMVHQSVMPKEVIEALAVKAGGVYFDGTFGGGGHSKLILEATGKVCATDKDEIAASVAQDFLSQYGDRFKFIRGSYNQVAEFDESFDGALLDLGLSSDQLDKSSRGFSYKNSQPLDMRFAGSGRSAADILNQSSYEELVHIFSTYGEDRKSKTLARKVIEQRKKHRYAISDDLIETIGTESPAVLSRLFAAVRIAVNDELGELERGLAKIVDCLKPGGRLAVISFHSGEDRIVKQFLKGRSDLRILSKKPLLPSDEEVAENVRARSAKLRLAEKLN